MADKAYFWIFEFGILRGRDYPKVFGAGLMTSMSELDKIAKGDVTTRSLGYENLLEESLISDMQNAYLVAEDVPSVESTIDQISHSLIALMGANSYA